MVFSLWKAFEKETTDSNSKLDPLSENANQQLEEKEIFLQFIEFLKTELVEETFLYSRPEVIVTPEQLRLFLVKGDWQSFHETAQEDGYNLIYVGQNGSINVTPS